MALGTLLVVAWARSVGKSFPAVLLVVVQIVVRMHLGDTLARFDGIPDGVDPVPSKLLASIGPQHHCLFAFVEPAAYWQ